MNHTDHVNLLRDGVPTLGGVWADLGSGTGAFTLALAELIGPQATIYSVDRDVQALKEQKRALNADFPTITMHFLTVDFTQPLDVPPLDGIVMANALHFHRAKAPILQHLYALLKTGGRLLMVEYNADVGNTWVPYPFSFSTWQTLAQAAGFAETRLLARRPSRFMNEIYSAVSLKHEAGA